MKLRTKTVITVVLLSLLIFGVLQIITVFVIQPSFLTIENNEAKEGLTQAKSIIDYQISDLTVKVKDYSFWDDTYDYALDGNGNYIENNFIGTTFENLNLNLVIIINNKTDVLYCQSFDLNTSTMVQTSKETIKTLTSVNNIWAFNSTEQTVSGLIIINNKTMLIASAPILTSINQGPIVGGMLFGKYIDDQDINQLTKLIQTNFTISTLTDFESQKKDNQIIKSLLSNSQTVVIKENNADTVSGYSLINDVNSNPMFVLQVTKERTAYQQGVLVGNIFLFAAIALSILSGIFLLFLLEREIVKPMIKLADYVEEISLNPNVLAPDLQTHSTEELAVLTNAVRDTLKRKLEGMNEVSRMVAHDLRNPLSGIKSASYFLKKKYGATMDEKGNAMLKTIDDCIAYSDKIVNNLFEYSSEIKINKVNTNPKKLVDDTLSKFLVPSNIKVANEIDDEISTMIDGEKMERVFTNLIANALDAMPKGGLLKITSKKIDNTVQISFSDNGVGMSKEILDKLWAPFFTTKAKGMGIGLSICKRIVDAHGGRIKVESVEGEGTCFKVFLPMAK
jgi:signal transduction histidine kinase